MSHFRNLEELVSHGAVRARRIALACLDAALRAADTYEGTRRIVALEEGVLCAGGLRFDLAERGRIFVVGAGKGSFPIARALDEILGPRIARGVVAVKEAPPRRLARIRAIRAAHPVPDAYSLLAGQEVQEIAAEVRAGDLVFACMTGGCSALLVLPVDGVSLEDKIALNRLLLRTGARIGEMNAVRKHVSRIKGGGLVKLLQPATVITLTQDTAPESLPWPDPSLPDPSTFAEAIAVLTRYEIWDQAPESVRRHLARGLTDPSLETPKSFEGWDAHLLDTGNQRAACLAAVDLARALGYGGHVLSTNLEGESREVGTVLSGIAKEIQRYHRPFAPPCVLVSAGETTVALRGPAGEGGPNQETVLGFARNIAGHRGIALAAIDSEGTDGPTDIAGGIADGETAGRLREAGLDLFEVLRTHNASPALRALGDAVITGPTGTNVVNLRILVVEESEHAHG
jgi:glycerate-2-kinase